MVAADAIAEMDLENGEIRMTRPLVGESNCNNTTDSSKPMVGGLAMSELVDYKCVLVEHMALTVSETVFTAAIAVARSS